MTRRYQPILFTTGIDNILIQKYFIGIFHKIGNSTLTMDNSILK